MVTPSSRRLRRHHRHLLCRRPRLPLRLLPRLALVEGGHRQPPTDQKGLTMVRLVAFGNRSDNGRRTERQQNVMAILKAGVLYFVLVFGAGFVL